MKDLVVASLCLSQHWIDICGYYLDAARKRRVDLAYAITYNAAKLLNGLHVVMLLTRRPGS